MVANWKTGWRSFDYKLWIKISQHLSLVDCQSPWGGDDSSGLSLIPLNTFLADISQGTESRSNSLKLQGICRYSVKWVK